MTMVDSSVNCSSSCHHQNHPDINANLSQLTSPGQKVRLQNNSQSKSNNNNNHLPWNFQKSRLNYNFTPGFHQLQTNHNYYQPSIGPNFLLGSPSTLAGAGPTSPSSVPVSGGASSATNAGSQFALTPDARACVTATYLCVLIVNNAWLDCNLLEMLCNNSSSTSSRASQDDDTSANPGSVQDENMMRLNSLESAVNKLIAFAGGGMDDDRDNDNGDDSSDNQREINQKERAVHFLDQRASYYVASPPIHLHLEPGDSKLARARAISTGDRDSDPRIIYDDADLLNRLLLYQSDRQAAIVNASPSDKDEKNKIVSDQQNRKRVNILLRSNHYIDQAETNIQQESAPVISAQEPNRQTIGGSLVSWVGRPFRGWNPWSDNLDTSILGEFNSPVTGQHQQIDQQANSRQQQVQILRPIDRTELYNDISTNQSALKSLSANNQRPKDLYQSNEGSEQQQPLATTMFPVSQHPSTVDDYMNTVAAGDSTDDMLLESASTRHQQLRPSSFQASRLQQQQQQQQTTVGLPSASQIISAFDYNGSPVSSNTAAILVASEQQQINQRVRQQQLYEQNECKCNDELMEDDQQINRSSPANPSAQLVSSTTSTTIECRLRCSQAASTPQPATSQQSTTPIMMIDSTQYIPSGTTYNQQQLTTTSPSGSSPGGSQIPATSATTPLSSTIGSSAKMNPLDVSFLLFTRYHRDLARDLAALASSNRNIGGPNGNFANPSPIAIATAAAAENLASTSELINLNNETTLSESRFNCSLPIKIIIHGFGSGGRRPWVTEMVFKLLDYEDVNVIVVDWEKGATLPNYVQAAGNTRLVGHKIATLIKSINSKYGLTGNSYHLIGFSLGAHVAGFAGMEIRNSTSVSRLWINRITGLDPASPFFEGYEANDRLDPSDAQFVDVIHSNGDGVLRGGFGSLQPMGHVDFYPNGGRVQVGCNSVLFSALSDIIYGKWQSLCNHRRALNFFMDSFEVSKCRFRSFNCDSYESHLKGECFDCGQNNEKCSYMGYLANYSKGRGKMYLTTHEEAPFCANQFIIKILGTKGYKTHWGKVEVTLVTLDGKNESFLLSSMNQQSSHHGGHDHGNGQKELSQHSMQSLIVAHPTLIDFTQILLRYTKYKGWIYSGDESWSIDKVFIMDSDGQVKSYCGYNTILESHMTTRLSLEPGNCTVIESSPVTVGSTQQQQASRMGLAAVQQQQQQTQQQQPSLASTSASPSSSQSTVPPTSSSSSSGPPQQQSVRTPRLFVSMLQQHPQGELQVAAAAITPLLSQASGQIMMAAQANNNDRYLGNNYHHGAGYHHHNHKSLFASQQLQPNVHQQHQFVV